MPCYYPMTLYKSRMGPSENGKWPLVSMSEGYRDLPVKVPCGRCVGCRLERARQWAVRCMHEAQGNDKNCFVTLTYRQDELIYGRNTTGTLVPRHLTLFWKRLRKEYGNGIRYFACGEYGGQYHRPHYHAAIFGFDFPDKKLSGAKNGNDYYSSDSLNHIWSHGNCIIGNLTFESASYVARYIMDKKLGEEASYYEQEGIEPEFVRMSRRPGIGSSWYDQFHTDLYPHAFCVIRGGIKSSIPRYYSNKYETMEPLSYREVKERRKDAMALQWRDNLPDRLRVRERVKISQIKSLTRADL